MFLGQSSRKSMLGEGGGSIVTLLEPGGVREVGG